MRLRDYDHPILSLLAILLVIVCFGCALKDGDEPERLPEEDIETGRVVWASATAAATSTPTNTPTQAPTDTPTPVPTATNTPAPTNTPTQKPTAGTVGVKQAEVNGTHGWKPWAWFTACNDRSMPQWRLQQLAKTDEMGRRIVQDPLGEWRFCVALPVYWAGGTSDDIGRCFDLIMANGATLKCVLGDTKKLENSINGAGKYGKGHNEMVEVQVDGSVLYWEVGQRGDASFFGADWQGDVAEVVVLDMFIDGFGG